MGAHLGTTWQIRLNDCAWRLSGRRCGLLPSYFGQITRSSRQNWTSFSPVGHPVVSECPVLHFQRSRRIVQPVITRDALTTPGCQLDGQCATISTVIRVTKLRALRCEGNGTSFQCLSRRSSAVSLLLSLLPCLVPFPRYCQLNDFFLPFRHGTATVASK